MSEAAERLVATVDFWTRVGELARSMYEASDQGVPFDDLADWVQSAWYDAAEAELRAAT